MQPAMTAALSPMQPSNGEAAEAPTSAQHNIMRPPTQPIQAREAMTGSSVSTASTNSVMEGLASRPEHQALYQAQQQQPMNTPWTLGSTDGSLATQFALMQEQQQQNAEEDPAFVPKPSVALTALAAKQSLYQDRILCQPSAAVEAVLAACCEVCGFDIAEIWLRTGPKTHQLTNSHLRPTALEDSVRNDLVDVYYGQQSSERTHRLSPALCKRAKEAGDVVWVTSHTPREAQALKASISNVRTAVAVPVCHDASNTNITVIFFSIRK
ncbi:hypothetical protein FisN_17Hh216 [Fistulifera solaris]|uniref:GAF domain-containing protein n=1 Tax=Fistulifera solaris TaxID=1519565 RepID=A0A1Z5JH70_FISSO|nr:hypothetical protein FisN_17Hh216 [Fistulifera solaris]|eukprot:GAX13276.1 hypothetical protein FisN_17Hh216 [Fistulifera solaris]